MLQQSQKLFTKSVHLFSLLCPQHTVMISFIIPICRHKVLAVEWEALRCSARPWQRADRKEIRGWAGVLINLFLFGANLVKLI
jgi:hypothetical protein